MALLENQSIGVFIDGGYYAKIDEGLEEVMQSHANLKGLLSFIPQKLEALEGIPRKRLVITECHFYKGRYRVNDASSKKLLYSERKFEDALIENDVIFHYKHLREIKNKDGKVTGVIEKGIDTWFALDTYELALYRDFDYVVLITGDADHEMLIRKLKALKAHVILLTWDPAGTNSTSPALREEACTHIEISKLMEEDKDLYKYLTKKI